MKTIETYATHRGTYLCFVGDQKKVQTFAALGADEALEHQRKNWPDSVAAGLWIKVAE